MPLKREVGFAAMTSAKDNVSIFEFDSISDYLTSVLETRQARRKSYSLRFWALRLGLKVSDSGNLSRILSGRRAPSHNMALRLKKDLGLSENEGAYFELLALGDSKISRQSLNTIKKSLLRSLEIERQGAGS